MSVDEASYVGEQDAAYRKGLVLGLTMAEVAFLLVFVLLLLVAFSATQQRRLRTELRSTSEAVAIAREVAEALNSKANPPIEDVRKLARVLAAVRGKDGATALTEFRKQVDSLNIERAAWQRAAAELVASMKRDGVVNADSVAMTIAQQRFEIQNKEGQLKRYEDRLRAVGEGKGERPCWVKLDGAIEFLYNVVLESDGIRMQEISPASRDAERRLLPMPVIRPDEVLSRDGFLERTRPLYLSSLAKNCRFFVVIYDGTQASEKNLYKGLLRTVEEHFYKRLDSGNAPF